MSHQRSVSIDPTYAPPERRLSIDPLFISPTNTSHRLPERRTTLAINTDLEKGGIGHPLTGRTFTIPRSITIQEDHIRSPARDKEIVRHNSISFTNGPARADGPSRVVAEFR